MPQSLASEPIAIALERHHDDEPPQEGLSFAESFRRVAGYQFQLRTSSLHHHDQSQTHHRVSSLSVLPGSDGLEGSPGRSSTRVSQSWHPVTETSPLQTSPLRRGQEDGENSLPSSPAFTIASSVVSDLNTMTPYRDAHQGFDEEERDDETRPLLAPALKIIEEPRWTPHSTFSQTIFNAVNILMGIGLLSLPFAFRLTGWVLGLSMLFLFAAMTRKTAGTVAKCLDAPVPSSLPFKTSCTFGDFGEVAFGLQGRGFISVVFVLELFAASVALVILTADSFVSLFPSLDLDFVKACTVALILPATLPRSLSLASYGSLVGVLALVNLLLIVLYSGLWTLESPGSIRNPAETLAFPENWMHVPLALGLVMSGFSGHSVFPSIYRDMIQPKQYPSMVNISYMITTTIYVFISVAGYLMFGSETREEISLNLPLVPSYNSVLIQITIWLVAFNSMTKYPLAVFPVNAQMELVIGRLQPCLPAWVFRLVICSAVSGCILLVSILLPGFHYIMAILGSLFCFTVSIVFPESCYLRLYGSELSPLQRLVSWSLILSGSVFGIIGTVWAFIPMDI